MRSPKQQAFMKSVRASAKIEAATLALDYFRRFPYPEAVKRLSEKLEQYEIAWRDAEKERTA